MRPVSRRLFSGLSIRTKLVTLIAILLGCISLFIFIYFPARRAYNENKAVAAKAQSIAEMTAYSISPALFFQDHAAAAEALNSAQQNKDLVYVIVLDDSGHVFSTINKGGAHRALSLHGQDKSYMSEDGSTFETVSSIHHNGVQIGELHLGISLDEVKAAIGESRKNILFVSLLIFLVGMIAVFGISTVITGPLTQMVETVERIAGGDLTRRANVPYPDEVGHLAASFNSMVDTLAAAQIELEKVNRSLEERVDVRTKELQQEIGERRWAEKQLEQSVSILRATLESTADGILVVDLNGKIQSFNRKFVDLWHIPQSILATQNDSAAIEFVLNQLKYPAAFVKKVQELYSQKEAESYDSLEFKDGRILERYSKPHRIGNETVGRVWSFRDVTERKRAQESIQRLLHAVEQSDEVIIMTDSDGVITFVNPAFERVYGFSRQEALGNTPRLIKSGMRTVEQYEKFWRDLLSGNSVRSEFVNKSKDGRLVTVDASVSPIFEGDGSITGFISVQNDVTQRKKMEEERKLLQQQLFQSQKMESIGTLAGGIAHDFNNILGIILGHTSFIKPSDLNQTTLSTNMVAITRAVQRGANLVRQILTFARKTDTALEPVNVNTTIEELSRMLRETFPKTIEITLQLDKSVPVITMDHTQLHQALLNLCVNARDAMSNSSESTPRGGSLTIRTEIREGNGVRMQFPDATSSHYVCVSVSDTGLGMDEITKQRIFEPFFTTKEPGKGTGLGLAVVYGVVKSHQGFVDVESTVASGTTFKLYVPIHSNIMASSQVEENRSDELPGGQETILLVEDEEGLLELMKKLLESRGYSVLTAQDGREAIRVYVEHKERIALVLTDIGLPKLDGKGVVMALAGLNPQVNIIVASGYLDPQVKAELSQAGAKEFVHKPYTPAEMLAKVREVIDRGNTSKPHTIQIINVE